MEDYFYNRGMKKANKKNKSLMEECAKKTNQTFQQVKVPTQYT